MSQGKSSPVAVIDEHVEAARLAIRELRYAKGHEAMDSELAEVALKAAALVTCKDRYRHRIRGTTYQVLFEAAKAQSSIIALDNMTMVVYQGEEDGLIWVRPALEFFDGRFEKLD